MFRRLKLQPYEKKILASDKIREDKNAMQILQKWKMVEISFLSELLFVKIFCGFMGGEKQFGFFFFFFFSGKHSETAWVKMQQWPEISISEHSYF